MRIIVVHLGLFLVGVSVAAWLRMFDHYLSGQSWAELFGQPIRLWIGAIIGSPAFELVYQGWAFLLANLLYPALVWVWVKFRGSLSQTAAALLGLLLGGGLYLALETLSYVGAPRVPYFDMTGTLPWMTPLERMLKLLLIYATVGFLCGWLYYRWLARRWSAGATAA